MQTVNYPSPTFVAAFDTAMATRTAFNVVVTNSRKRLAIVRTIKRLKGELSDDRFFSSLADKFSLVYFYPCLANAWLSHHYSINLSEEKESLVLTFQPTR